MPRKVKVAGYSQAAQISTVSGSDLLIVVHNNSTHYLVLSAEWEAEKQPEEATVEESFRYTCEPNSAELAYMRALVWAVNEAMQR